MKIVVLHGTYATGALPFAEIDEVCDVRRHLEDAGHEVEEVYVAKATAARQVAEVARRGVDVVVNMCDGSWEDDSPGVEVVQSLERLGVAFTGASSRFYDPSREAMKMACHAAGVRFPAYVMARTEADVARAAAELCFPLLVKHPHGYASVGLTRDSRVTDVDALRAACARTMAEFGAALVEEFVEGDEYTVLVTEPRDDAEHPEDAWALPPVQFVFPEGETFKHFDLKWRDWCDMAMRVVTDEPLAGRLREAAALAFTALGGDGYARCDLRVSASGEVHVLELNPNCGVFYPEGAFDGADVSLAHDPAGPRGFVEHLLRRAVRRRDAAARPWELRHRRGRGFGLHATRPIAEGDVAVRYEERPHTLASRGHVERHWHGLKRAWFAHYAWPLTRELHVLWSDDPAEWRPLNHSCDPNTWLAEGGLDLVARRAIDAGEELTVDYATFCGEEMAPFDCACGAPICRGVVTGRDHLLPELRARYGGHVSEYVRSRA